MIVTAHGRTWQKVTPRSSRQFIKNLFKRLNLTPHMAANKIEYKPLPDRPDGEHYRIPMNKIDAVTNKAVLVDFGDVQHWLPISLVVYGVTGRQRAVDMPEWLARKHKLI